MDQNCEIWLTAAKHLSQSQGSISVPADNEVTIAIRATGLCGSDLHFFADGRNGFKVMEHPWILGHETSGLVVKVGAMVSSLQEGDRVALEPGRSCTTCAHCKKGKYNLCSRMVFLGALHVNGSLRDYLNHPSDLCFKIPDSLSFEEAALIEPLAVAIHACKRSSLAPGISLLICGAGPIGLLVLQVAKAFGVSTICIVDISATRLRLAERLATGVVRTVSGQGKSPEEVAVEVCEALGQQPDVTVECSGAESCLRTAVGVSVLLCGMVQATKSGGTVVLVGVGGPYQNVETSKIVSKELEVRGVFRYANCYPLAISLIQNGSIDLNILITHRFSLEQAEIAFKTALNDTSAVKVIIEGRQLNVNSNVFVQK